jgi:hypothetical protein
MNNLFKSLSAEKKAEVIAIADNIQAAFKTGGFDLSGERISIRDALATPDSHLAIQKVVTELVQDSVEPNLIGHLLLEQMFTTDRGQQQVTIRTLGALGGYDFTISEEGEYPEIGLGRGQQNVIHANYGKYGAKLKISEEMLAGSQWNLIDHWIRKTVSALARFKEEKIFAMLDEFGETVFDNANPSAAIIGRTLGRDIHGQGNGSMTTGDLIDMYSHLLKQGYVPNVILVHPLHWAMFAKDPIIREAGLARGDISQWLASQVSPVNPYKYISGWQAASRAANGDAQRLTAEESNQLLQTTPTLPSYSPLSGLTVIPSPYVPYDEDTNTASIIMIDTRNTGVLITNEQLTIDGWDEKANDLKVIKLREKYALALYDQGRAVAIARNISLEPNEIFNNPQITIENLPVISRK